MHWMPWAFSFAFDSPGLAIACWKRACTSASTTSVSRAQSSTRRPASVSVWPSAVPHAPAWLAGAALLSVTIGNLWVLVVNAGVKNAAVTNFIASTGFGTTAFQMFFFAAFAFVAALVFGLCARSYQVVDHYRKG